MHCACGRIPTSSRCTTTFRSLRLLNILVLGTWYLVLGSQWEPVAPLSAAEQRTRGLSASRPIANCQ